jgi:exonuclease III
MYKGRDGRKDPRPPYKPFVNDVRFRFHNVQSLRDKSFRQLYLKTARLHCEILALTELNCSDDEEMESWARDWPASGGVYYATSHYTPERGSSARGVAIFLASTLNAVNVSYVWRDPHGRGLAIRADIHNKPTVIVAFHADCDSDAAQMASYEKVRENVPYLKECDYVWMLDANNVVCRSLDEHNDCGRGGEDRMPNGIASMLSCADKWGGDGGHLMDAFRQLYPTLSEYTRSSRHTGSTTWRRIDRVMVSPRLCTKGLSPFVERVRHVWPSDEEMLALERMGSSSKWSDHAAVEMTMRFSDTLRPPRAWKYPGHMLANTGFVDNTLRTKAAAALQHAVSGADPKEVLLSFLSEARTQTHHIVKTHEHAHRERKGRVLKQLRAARDMVGDTLEPGGSLRTLMTAPASIFARLSAKRRDWIIFKWMSDRKARIQRTEHRRDQLLEEWADICRREQQRWCDDKGFDDFVAGESCCKQFFQHKTESRTYSYIDRLKNKGGHWLTGTSAILAYAKQHFGDKGSIFNLCEPAHPEDRQTILEALVADGRELRDEDRDMLSMDKIFSAERVQQAIDELQNGTQTGEDGWTAEFFKVVGMRAKKDKSGERAPSALAGLLALTFKRCAQGDGGKGCMMDIMRTSIVSLIFKDKGNRHDLGKYRPIAVNSIVYRIMAKALVIAIRPHLAFLTDHSQKAFKIDDLISDNTRMVQDIIAFCQREGIPGILVFADQDNAYPRVRWDYLFDVMRTMRVHPDFIRVVEMMYSGIELKLKVNGTVSKESFQPTNGIAQGCPLSPCLYLLCIQGLISLTVQHARRADGIRGIPIPDAAGAIDTPVTSLVRVC